MRLFALKKFWVHSNEVGTFINCCAHQSPYIKLFFHKITSVTSFKMSTVNISQIAGIYSMSILLYNLHSFF